MSESIEIGTISAPKTNINQVSDSPVTDPASGAKVCEDFYTLSHWYILFYENAR